MLSPTTKDLRQRPTGQLAKDAAFVHPRSRTGCTWEGVQLRVLSLNPSDPRLMGLLPGTEILDGMSIP